MKTIKLPSEESMYLDWVNNFLTVQCFADHYMISRPEALRIINEQRNKINN